MKVALLLMTMLPGLFAGTGNAAPGSKYKKQHSLSYYSAHYRAHDDLPSLRAVARHIKVGWKLSQARVLLGEGVDMGYGGYRYSARNTYITLELSIKPTADGRDTIITAKALEKMME